MNHIAFIMDGNGRWAEEKGLERCEGYRYGAKALIKAINAIDNFDIKYISFYAFSTENNKRNEKEVGAILNTIAYFLNNEIKKIVIKKNFIIKFIGEIDLLPEFLRNTINDIKKISQNNNGKYIIFALNYGGDKEILNAVNTLIKKGDNDITINDIKNNLYTYDIPDPDVVVRYGKHKRLSNFMPLQTIYSELMFYEKYWPDFAESDMNIIIENYKNIKRNFGGSNA